MTTSEKLHIIRATFGWRDRFAMRMPVFWRAVVGSPSGLPVSNCPGLPTLSRACRLSIHSRLADGFLNHIWEKPA